MKIKFSLVIAVILLLLQSFSFGQTAPNLGTTSGFALFTAAGAFNVTGSSTVVTGDVGTNNGAFNGFAPGTLTGTKHVADPTSTLAATDVATAYSDLNQGGSVIGVGLGGQTLTQGVYQTGAASTLNGNITLDGGGNSNALFIIRIGGALSVSASSTVTLINSASLCNVYWQIDGKFDLEDGAIFEGTLIATGAINLLGSSTLLGRGLSTAGAISLPECF